MRKTKQFRNTLFSFSSLALLVLSNNAFADADPLSLIITDYQGPGVCRANYRPLEKAEAEFLRPELLKTMRKFQITRLADGWVMGGSGYKGRIYKGTSFETFCYPENGPAIELGPLPPVDLPPVFDDYIAAKFFKVEYQKLVTGEFEDVDLSKVSELKDGFYLVDKGQGWIRGEQDFIAKGYANSGNSVSVGISTTTSSSNSVEISGGISLSWEVLGVALNWGYGQSWEKSKTSSANLSFTAPEDQNLYARVYSSHQRFDGIQISNGEVVKQTVTYIPTGLVGKQIYYPRNGFFNEDTFLEYEPRRATDAVGAFAPEQTYADPQEIGSAAASDAPSSQSDKTKTYRRIGQDGDAKTMVGSLSGINDFGIDPDKITKITKLSDDGQSLEYEINPDDFAQSMSPAPVQDENSTGDSDSPYANLTDGFYLVNLGEHWISGDDGGVLYTFVSPENSSVAYTEQLSASYRQSTNRSVSHSLRIAFVNGAITRGYSRSWSESYTSTLSTPVSASDEKSSFTKIYSVNDRVDVIQISGGKLVAQTATYIPNSFVAEEVEYAPNKGYDQKLGYIYEGVSLNPFSQPQGNTYIPMLSNSLMFDAGTISNYRLYRSDLQQIKPATNYDIGYKFKVGQDGLFDIGHFIDTSSSGVFTGSKRQAGWWTDYEIWELSPVNDNLGIKIASTKVTKTVISNKAFKGNARKWGFPYSSGMRNGFATRLIPLQVNRSYALIVRGFSNGKVLSAQSVSLSIQGAYNRNIPQSQLTRINFVGGDVPPMDVITGRVAYNLRVPTNYGYIFDGWYTEPEMKNRFYSGMTLVQGSSMTLYPKWVPEQQ